MISFIPPEETEPVVLVVMTNSEGFYQSGLTPSGTTYTVSVQHSRTRLLRLPTTR